MSYKFVHETSNNQVKRFVALLVMVVLIVSGLVIAAVNYGRAQNKVSSESFFSRYTPNIVDDITPLKQFLISTLSGMIIFPIPNEVVFYVGLRQGNPPLLSVLATVGGFVLGNIMTYLLGMKLSKQLVYLLSTRKIYELRRKVNTYGVYAVIVINLLPLPSDILTFGLGTIRYNFKRLFLFLTLANFVKFGVSAYLIYQFHQAFF